MTKINKKSTRAVRATRYQAEVAADASATTNLAGGLAFTMKEKTELFTRVMSCFFSEPKFYGSTGDSEKRIVELTRKIAQTDPEWVLRLAKFVRHEGYMRTIPVALLVETADAVRVMNKNLPQAERTKLSSVVRPYVGQIVSRADEIAETLAYYISKFDKDNKMPMSLKRGLADAFTNFSAYQLIKYDREGEISLKDAISILHPKWKNDDMKVLYKYLRGWNFAPEETKNVLAKVDGRQAIINKKTIDKEVLEAASKGNITWEVFISHFGGNKDSWTAIAPFMPYMATMRNLRNMLENDVPAEVLKVVAAKLEDEKAVAKAMQFPFRYYSAHRELERSGVRVPSFMVKALSNALELSIKNIPHLDGTTFVVSDNSSSMHAPLSAKSTVQMIDVGALMSAMSYHFSDDAIVGAFGETFKFVTMNPKDSIISNMEKIRNANVGHSTNAWLTIKALIDKKLKVDRIFLFSDMQCYNSVGWGSDRGSSLASMLKEYKRSINPNVMLYTFDLSTYGTAQFSDKEENVFQLAGFSDKIFKFVEIVEKGASMVDVIAKY